MMNKNLLSLDYGMAWVISLSALIILLKRYDHDDKFGFIVYSHLPSNALVFSRSFNKNRF